MAAVRDLMKAEMSVATMANQSVEMSARMSVASKAVPWERQTAN